MKRQLIRRLEDLEQQRLQVQNLDKAMAQLTPTEQLILRKLVMDPGRHNAAVLCDLLDVGSSTIYRRRDRAIQRLLDILYP